VDPATAVTEVKKIENLAPGGVADPPESGRCARGEGTHSQRIMR
jgi:hypothetical protein